MGGYDQIKRLGFRRVGSWHLSSGSIFCRLERESKSSNLLYSFISEEEVVYIGKTRQPLNRRMYNYKNPGPTQSTNIRVNALIGNALVASHSVDIYVLPDDGSFQYRGIRINLAAGLEDSLVAAIEPIWNLMGK